MSHILCIDWGNSLLKYAVFNGDATIVEKDILNPDQATERIADIAAQYQVQAGIMCSVTHESTALAASLKESLPYFIELDTHTNLPVMNAYSSSDTLGMDRVALVVAAYTLFPEHTNLVISAGTCITYNLIQKNKAFRGGAISPGLHMRFKALHQFTDRLPEVKPDTGELLLLGYDTQTSIRSGVIYGIAAEMDGMIEAYTSQYPDFNVLLTGGDISYFESKLKSKIFADPNLLLKGLYFILKHNVPQIS